MVIFEFQELKDSLLGWISNFEAESFWLTQMLSDWH